MILSGTSSLSVDQLMQNQTKREGTVLKLECEITGNPKPIYNWYKNDILIASANQVKHDDYTHRLKLQDVPFGGKLRLEPILKDDAGWYKCVAENSNGVRETSAFIEVNPDVLFRERYLQKQQRERNNPSSSKNSAGMPARVKSSANQKQSVPSSIIDDSVNGMLSSLSGGTGLDSNSPFGLPPPNNRIGDGIFFLSPREDQTQTGELLSASQMGSCEPYTGSICKDTLHGRPGAHVFVSSRSSQEQVERMLEAIITEINSQPGVVGHDCAPYIAPMLCYHHLPPCADQHLPGGDQAASNEQQVALRFQRHSQSTTKYLPMEICQEDCVAVQTRYCRAEYAKMWSQQPSYGHDKRQRSSMMLIGDRPLVPDCSILRRSTQPKISEDYVGCVRLGDDLSLPAPINENVTPFTRIVPLAASNSDETSDCYSGNGFNYQGKAKRTKSGKTCANWSSTDYAPMVGENGNHNYCRNPAGDLPSPWCYTTPPYHRELCDIPKCNTQNDISTRLIAAPPPPQNHPSPPPSLFHHHTPATQQTPLTFGSLPVFLPIIAVPVLFCLIALLLLCMCRNRIAKRCRRHRCRHRSNSNGSGSKMTPAEQERSASSTHYYAGGFRSTASPGAGLFHQHANNFLLYGALPGQALCGTNGSNGIHNVEPTFKHQQSIQMPTYPLAALRFFEQISDSSAARVFRGEITAAFCESGLPSQVMVKMLRNGDQAANSFNNEVELLAGLQHPNIAHLVGVCFGPRPWCLLFECLSTDSLRQFLVNSLRQPYLNDDQEMLYDEMGANSPFLQHGTNQASLGTSSLEHSDLIYIAVQIAAALEHMTGSQQQLVHRELNSHTIHVGDHLLIKVLPFSACRSGSASAAILPPGVMQGAGNANRGRLSSLSSTAGPDGSPHGSPALSPHAGRVAWLAPETILYGRQSAESDVWSFGIILWELFSYGCEPYSKASQMPGVDDRRIAELILGRSLLQRPTAAAGLISEGSADCPNFVYELMLECWDEIPSRRPTFADIHARLLQWRSEGLFKLRPASSAAINHQSTQHLTIGYDAAFPMPPLPRMCSTSQQSSGSSSSHQVAGDAASASTHHTITSVGSSDKGSGSGSGNAPAQHRQQLFLPPPVPPPHYTLPVEDFENSYSDGGVYCGGSGSNGSKDSDHANQGMYESHGEEEENLLIGNQSHKNEALAHLQFSFGTEQQLAISRQQQQQIRRTSTTASPLLQPKNQSLGSFSTTFGGPPQQYHANGTGKRRLVVTANDSEAVPTVTARIGQTTAM